MVADRDAAHTRAAPLAEHREILIQAPHRLSEIGSDFHAPGCPRRRGLMSRLGSTIPLDSTPLAGQLGQLDDIAARGFTDLWSAEASGADAFTPLVAASVSHPSLRLDTTIIPAYTRGPALMTMSAATSANVAHSEVALGIGTSSDCDRREVERPTISRPLSTRARCGNVRTPGH
ncbi:LLM class flavin-dependent oxidoreductase [Nocardia sp. NPDC050713]|uniref:LLM class flavin-dependent oxidoreductase n=1 Tax=Nocardia sp. NPDC050713 TaxID=3154511 RepID=UPI0033C73327